jgi:hypothetical protein
MFPMSKIKYWWEDYGSLSICVVIAVACIMSALYGAFVLENKRDNRAYHAWCKLQGTNVSFQEWVDLKNAHALPGIMPQ